MDLEELNRRIAAANAQAKQLNDERQVNIGKREMLKKRLDSLLNEYNTAHGTSVTLETLEAEVSRVMQEKTAEVEKMEKALALVSSGDYAGAEGVLGVVKNTDASVVAPVAEIPASVSGMPTSSMNGVSGYSGTNLGLSAVDSDDGGMLAPPPGIPPKGNAVPGVEKPVAPPVMPKVAGKPEGTASALVPPIFQQIESQSKAAQSAVGSKPVTSFGDILGGTQFAGGSV